MKIRHLLSHVTGVALRHLVFIAHYPFDTAAMLWNIMRPMKMIEAIEWRAREFAKVRHDATGVLYNDVPYFEGHVVPVRELGAELGYTSGVWGARFLLHDGEEDCTVEHLGEELGITRSILQKEFGLTVELPVFCVSGFGETRKIRNADQYRKIIAYDEIMDDHAAAIVKGIDRTINLRKSAGNNYHKMYLKEMPDYAEVIRPRVPEAVWNALEAAANG